MGYLAALALGVSGSKSGAPLNRCHVFSLAVDDGPLPILAELSSSAREVLLNVRAIDRVGSGMFWRAAVHSCCDRRPAFSRQSRAAIHAALPSGYSVFYDAGPDLAEPAPEH